MPPGDKSNRSNKMESEVEYVVDSCDPRDAGKKEAKRRARSRVNRMTGAAKKRGEKVVV